MNQMHMKKQSEFSTKYLVGSAIVQCSEVWRYVFFLCGTVVASKYEAEYIWYWVIYRANFCLSRNISSYLGKPFQYGRKSNQKKASNSKITINPLLLFASEVS